MTVLSDLRAGRGSAPASRALIYLPWTALVIDAAIVSLSALLAAFLRIELSFFHSDMDVLARPWLAITSVTVGWLIFIWGFGAYRSDVFGAGTDEFKRIMHAGLYTAAALGVGCYLANYSLSRGFFGLTFLIGIPALLVGRLVLRRFLYAARRRGSLLQRVVIVGGVDNIDEIARVLSRDPWLGYHVVGAISPNAMGETPGGVPILGTDPTSIVTEHRADVLFFTGGSDRSAEQLRQWMWALEDHAVQLVVAISMTDISAERVRHRAVGGLPL
ncbi:MAG: nucleoside-diphosphate sugar epimerase/dehydratase, partial [Nocardioides sp.]